MNDFRICLIPSLAALLLSCSVGTSIQDMDSTSISLDSETVLKNRIRSDLCEQFFAANDIRDKEEYERYQYLLRPVVHHAYYAKAHLDEENIGNLFFYDCFDGAYLLAYGFDSPLFRYSAHIFTVNLLYGETEYRFPLRTYPSVWKDGVIYPTLSQAYDAGVIPEECITVEYWGQFKNIDNLEKEALHETETIISF